MVQFWATDEIDETVVQYSDVILGSTSTNRNLSQVHDQVAGRA